MTARQPRRTRRRNAPADSLPRLRPEDRSPAAEVGAQASGSRRTGVREHNVTNDYRYVRHEMLIIGLVSLVTFGFIVAMSFVV